MQDAKEEVRSRLNIEDVIGEYVQLKRAGRNFKGLSPFSQEKTPSFFVSPEKHIWHDFSSNKGGDIFSFVMEVEGLDFRGALEHLARKAGVDLSLYQSSAHQGLAKKKRRVQEALNLAANYYQHSLLKNQHALEYVFKKRHLSKEMVQDFKIGYAPSTGDALKQFLLKKGFRTDELKDAGLLSSRSGDMFRGRMTVPLMDGQGEVIGFTARLIADDPKAPKYINTPQTILYDKSRHVFGLHLAKEAIRQADYAVIVEGNLDVVSSHQVGVRQVVATAGTALTEYHLKVLSRLSGNIRLAFDADRAGVAATERAIPIAQTIGVQLAIITLPDGAKDPDELIQNGPDVWQRTIEAAEPAIDWVLKQYQARYDTSTAEGKRKFSSDALALITKLSDEVEKEHYMQQVAQLTGASIEALAEKAKRTASPAAATTLKVVKTSPTGPDPYAYQDNLLAVLLSDTAARETLKKTSSECFNGSHRQKLAAFLTASQAIFTSEIPEDLQEMSDYVKMLLLKVDARYAVWSAQERYHEAAKLVRQVQTEHLKQTKQQLMQALQEAEIQHDEAAAVKLRTELNKLIKEQVNAKK
ncbi:MAG TPA: DNA primase [Verrucomicrobiae bacterium]|nr:DNA primase [Verrucomicrobiae bacterium]